MQQQDSFEIDNLNDLSIFFDEDFYLKSNPDLEHLEYNPFKHFLDYGFLEERIFSPFVDLQYLRSIGAHEGWEINSPTDLSRELGRISSTSLYGSSPIFCPRWLADQIGCRNLAFSEMLNLPLKDAFISPHPIMKHLRMPSNIEFVRDLPKILWAPVATNACLISLNEYVSNYKNLGAKPGLNQVEHFIKDGIFENRLTFVGSKKNPKMNFEELFFSMIIAIYQPALFMFLSPRRIETLPASPIKILDDKDYIRIKKISSKFENGAKDTFIEDVLAVNQLLYSYDGDLVCSPAYIPARYPQFTDRDLLSGRLPVLSKRVVYSVNLGGYDRFPTPPDLPEASYILITDDPCPPPSCWTIVRPTLIEPDTKRLCLWYKTHPHILFPKAEFVVWIDSNIVCMEGSGSILLAHEALSEVAAFTHPDRQCLYDEAEMIKKLRLDDALVVNAHVERLEKDRMPKKAGLFETNVLFSRSYDLVVRSFFDEWWRLICLGSRRDQLSFGPAARAESVTVTALDGMLSTKSSRSFTKRPHISIRERFL